MPALNGRTHRERSLSRDARGPVSGVGLITTLLALRDTAVLELSSMPDLYATLGAADALAAQTKYKAYTSIWCCSKPPGPKMPGHIWYDMFFDVVPHENRHRRVWQTKWTPEFGP